MATNDGTKIEEHGRKTITATYKTQKRASKVLGSFCKVLCKGYMFIRKPTSSDAKRSETEMSKAKMFGLCEA